MPAVRAVRIPKTVIEQARLQEGDELTIQALEGRITIESLNPKMMTIESLVAGITCSGSSYYQLRERLPVRRSTSGSIRTTGVVLADAIKTLTGARATPNTLIRAPVDVMKAVRERLMAVLDLEP